MEKEIIIRSDMQMARAIEIIRTMPFDPVHIVSIGEHDKDRTNAQNRLSFMHYSQIAKQMAETPDETRARCKLDYGVPLLIAKKKDFARKWLNVTKRLNRVELLDAAFICPVTSLMGVKMMTEYIKTYMHVHESNEIVLSHPKDLYYQAMGIRTK